MISSRALLLFLVVLNLIAFAWWSGSLGVFSDSRREPQRFEKQIEPDRIKLLPPDVTASDQRPAVPAERVAGADAERAGLPALDSAARQLARAGAISGTLDTTKQTTALAADRDSSGPAIESAAQTGDPTPVIGPAADTTSASSTSASSTSVTSTADDPDASASATTARSSAATNGADAGVALAGRATASDGDARVADARPASPVDNASVQPSGAVPVVAEASATCVVFPAMDFISARQWRDRLAAQASDVVMRRLDDGNYLLFIEPLGSRAEAERLSREMKALGFDDAQVIGSGVFRNGVSLAAFASADRANTRRQALLARGVANVTVTVGPTIINTSRYQLEVRATADVIAGSVRPVANRAQFELATCP